MLGTWVQPLAREVSTCSRAAKPMDHNSWAPAPHLEKPLWWMDHTPQLDRSPCLSQLRKAWTWPQSFSTATHKINKWVKMFFKNPCSLRPWSLWRASGFCRWAHSIPTPTGEGASGIVQSGLWQWYLLFSFQNIVKHYANWSNISVKEKTSFLSKPVKQSLTPWCLPRTAAFPPTPCFLSAFGL